MDDGPLTTAGEGLTLPTTIRRGGAHCQLFSFLFTPFLLTFFFFIRAIRDFSF